MKTQVDDNGVQLPPVQGTGDFVKQWTDYAKSQQRPIPVFITATPKVAEIVMSHNTNNRRKIKVRLVEKYANDMTHGKWKVTAQAISFGIDGVLHDGQNRMGGLILSGKTIEFLMVFGQNNDAVEATDIGSARDIGTTHGLSSAQGSTARGLLLTGNVNTPSHADIDACYKRNKHYTDRAIELVSSAGSVPKGIVRQSVRVAVARALKHEPAEKIAAFCEVLCHGGGSRSVDAAVRKFRDKLISKDRTFKEWAGKSGTTKLFYATQSHIKAYCEGRVKKSVKIHNKVLYPMSHDLKVKNKQEQVAQ